jgi:hypothetical protein
MKASDLFTTLVAIALGATFIGALAILGVAYAFLK